MNSEYEYYSSIFTKELFLNFKTSKYNKLLIYRYLLELKILEKINKRENFDLPIAFDIGRNYHIAYILGSSFCDCKMFNDKEEEEEVIRNIKKQINKLKRFNANYLIYNETLLNDECEIIDFKTLRKDVNK